MIEQRGWLLLELSKVISESHKNKRPVIFKKNKDYDQEVFARFLGNTSYLMDVDFMFVDRSTLDKILKEAGSLTISGQKFVVPSLNHLIALKLHAIKNNEKNRLMKDLPDIVNLIKNNGIDVRNEDFKNLCLKFGTENLYQRLLEVIK